MNPNAPVFYPYQRKPSLNFHDFWEFAQNPNASFNPYSPYSGKFLVFVDIKDLDKTWQQVYNLTIKGELGPFSKTSTSRPNQNALYESIKVVIIYTSDFRDHDEIARIAWVLYEQGIFTGTFLNYKTDEATRARLYSSKLGDPEFCMYSISLESFQLNNSRQKFTESFKEKHSAAVHESEGATAYNFQTVNTATNSDLFE